MSKIRCEAYRSVWVEVSEEDGVFECPECGGSISVDDDSAEHEDVEWVECPVNPGEHTLALLESEDGEDIACDHCEIENAITVSDGEAVHDNIAWVECPFTDEDGTVVNLDEDSEVDCDHCNGSIYIEDGEAEHEGYDEVACPVNPGESTGVFLGDDREEECDYCGMAITIEDGEASHEDVEWVECPFFEGKGTLVSTEEDDEVDCDHCNGSIYVENGEADHEDFDEVECPLNEGKTTVVFLGDDREEDCDHCGGVITIENGEATHEPWESCLDQLQEGEDGKDLIIVHGWLNNADKDYEEWRKQCIELGWSGNIWGYQWESGGILDKLGLALLALARVIVKHPAIIPAAVVVQLAAWLVSFRRARAAAEQEGETLASAIGEAIDQRRKVTVIGFSLGCRVVLFALRALGKAGYKNAVTVHLCGGAVEDSESWKTQSIKKLTNYYSSGDHVLGAIFRVGTIGSSAIGSVGLDTSVARKCRNIEALVDGDPIGHMDYEDCFAEFGEL